MLNEEVIDKLMNTLAACDAHNSRMKSALTKLSILFPLSTETFIELTDDQYSYSDQLILRFLRLQDLMGKKRFAQTLLLLEEDYSDRPFLDIIYRLEQLRIIDSAEKWISLREIRNLITHDYPHLIDELLDGLNQLPVKANELSDVYESMKIYILSRIGLADQFRLKNQSSNRSE